MNKLSIKALGLSLGIVWAAYVILLGWIAALSGYGCSLVELIGSVYLGYNPTILGGIIGGAWAFVDGAIAGAVFAWVYNKFTG